MIFWDNWLRVFSKEAAESSEPLKGQKDTIVPLLRYRFGVMLVESEIAKLSKLRSKREGSKGSLSGLKFGRAN